MTAPGAWLPREFGVRTLVQAGRGCFFTVEADQPAEHALYLPHHRMACTPYRGRFRIVGTTGTPAGTGCGAWCPDLRQAGTWRS